MLGFLKKKIVPVKVAPTPKVFVFPDDRMEEVILAWYKYLKAEENKDLERYKFWILVESIFPETTKGGWRLNRDGARYKIEEIVE